MSQMKEQDKTSGKKQLNKGEDRQPSRKIIQNNDTEDDPGSRGQGGRKWRRCKKYLTNTQKN